MAQNVPDKQSACIELNPRNQAASIIRNVKNNTTPNAVDVSPGPLDSLKVPPVRVPHDFVPCIKRSFPLRMVGNSKADLLPANDAH